MLSWNLPGLSATLSACLRPSIRTRGHEMRSASQINCARRDVSWSTLIEEPVRLEAADSSYCSKALNGLSARILDGSFMTGLVGFTAVSGNNKIK